MPRLIYSATCSLDGYMAGPDGDMSWLTEHLQGPNPHAERLLAGRMVENDLKAAAKTNYNTDATQKHIGAIHFYLQFISLIL